MVTDFNSVFARGWFGPFIPPVNPEKKRMRIHGGSPIYDKGPMDGLKTTLIWASRMSARPPGDLVTMGQNNPAPCPPGQVGYMGPDGVRCTSAPSGMIDPYGRASTIPGLRTFEAGPWWSGNTASGTRLSGKLGQGVETMTPPDREAMLAAITDALNKVPELDDLVAYSGKYDTNLTRTLGNDATRFFALSNSIAPLYSTVTTVLDRLYEPEPAMWTIPTASESAAVRQWVTGINEMHKIYLAHKNQPLQVPEEVPAPPGFTNTKKPSTTETIIRTEPPKTASKEISTETLLVGGGIVAGLGLLVYLVS